MEINRSPRWDQAVALLASVASLVFLGSRASTPTEAFWIGACALATPNLLSYANLEIAASRALITIAANGLCFLIVYQIVHYASFLG